jgi:hypothetical protein
MTPKEYIRMAITMLETAHAMLNTPRSSRKSSSPLRGRPLAEAHKKAISRGMKKVAKQRNKQ